MTPEQATLPFCAFGCSHPTLKEAHQMAALLVPGGDTRSKRWVEALAEVARDHVRTCEHHPIRKLERALESIRDHGQCPCPFAHNVASQALDELRKNDPMPAPPVTPPTAPRSLR